MFALSAGEIVADKYRVDRVIGAGGMGVVVSATHLELDQQVALKFLRSSSEEALSRFKREARLIVKLKSVHVARVFDVGEVDDGTPFIVMELLEGEDLSKVVDRQGLCNVEQVVDWVLEACEAIAEAHALGMIHRDLKPANLFLAKGPGGVQSVKVLDFGVGKKLEGPNAETTTGGLTNEGMALGSPGYMAPEQMTSSRDVDERADIYSIGAIMYRLCGGQNPHKGDSLVAILASMATVPLVPLKKLVPTVPERFSDIVSRCLSQEASARPATLAELAAELVTFGSRKAKASTDQILATMGQAPATIVSPLRVASDPGPTITTVLVNEEAPLTPTIVASPPPMTPPMVVAAHVPFERSDTAPDARRRAQARQQRAMNAALAIGGGAMLAGVIAWVASQAEPKPQPQAPPQVIAEPAPTPTPAPTPSVIAPPDPPAVSVAPPDPPVAPKPKPKHAPSHKPDQIPGGRH